ncbi:hypothetical protein [Phenylobacterium sp.]|uniref:hypothetical protein n=1 Tax=Phenylobacterium sp. TaxID=1871053 RepID=UPI003983451F
MGPEVAFAHNFPLAHPNEVLMIVKSAKRSTGLAQYAAGSGEDDRLSGPDGDDLLYGNLGADSLDG